MTVGACLPHNLHPRSAGGQAVERWSFHHTSRGSVLRTCFLVVLVSLVTKQRGPAPPFPAWVTGFSLIGSLTNSGRNRCRDCLREFVGYQLWKVALVRDLARIRVPGFDLMRFLWSFEISLPIRHWLSTLMNGCWFCKQISDDLVWPQIVRPEMAALRLVVVVEMMSCEWMDLYPCWRSSTYTVLGIYWKMIGVIIQSHL